jgi:hypothetical protein
MQAQANAIEDPLFLERLFCQERLCHISLGKDPPLYPPQECWFRRCGQRTESLDVLEIITVFSARLYGSRSQKNKQIVKQLKEVANNLK